MPRYMVRQRIERKIILDANTAQQANAIVFERYSDVPTASNTGQPPVKDPVARVVVHEDYDDAIAIKPGAFPAEIEKL